MQQSYYHQHILSESPATKLAWANTSVESQLLSMRDQAADRDAEPHRSLCGTWQGPDLAAESDIFKENEALKLMRADTKTYR